MSDLYIANLSKQHHLFIYTVLEGDTNSSDRGRAYQRHEHLPAGGQARLPGELTADQVRAIVDHHRGYGMKPWNEARKIKGFTGLCFRIGAPVPMNDQGFIDEVVRENEATLTQANDVRREATAAAITQSLQRLGAESRNPLQRTQLEQVEDTDGTPRIASGVEMPSDGIQPRNQGKRRGPVAA